MNIRVILVLVISMQLSYADEAAYSVKDRIFLLSKQPKGHYLANFKSDMVADQKDALFMCFLDNDYEKIELTLIKSEKTEVRQFALDLLMVLSENFSESMSGKAIGEYEYLLKSFNDKEQKVRGEEIANARDLQKRVARLKPYIEAVPKKEQYKQAINFLSK